MPTLHLLPGESQGDTAEIVASPVALDRLAEILQEARYGGFASHRFQQRDRYPYSLNLRVLEEGPNTREWGEIPLGYMLHGSRWLHYGGYKRGFDLSKLAAALYSARQTKGHSQREAAATMGVSLGFVSTIENMHAFPKGSAVNRIAEYSGRDPAEFLINL